MDSPTLDYKQIVYTSNKSGLYAKGRTIKFLKQSDGKYGLKPNQALIKVSAVALNPIDTLLYEMMKPWWNLSGKLYGIGLDYSGTVNFVGEEFSKSLGINLSDKVCGFVFGFFGEKTLGEYIVLDTTKKNFVISKIPKNLSMFEAAAFPTVTQTSLQALQESNIQPNSKVLVNGTGSALGRSILPMLRTTSNVCKIVGVCSPRSEELSKKLGAEVVLNYKSPTFINDLAKQVEDRPFDVILDLTGSEVLVSNISKILKKNGTYTNTAGGKAHNLKGDSLLSALTYGYIKFNVMNKLYLTKYKICQTEISPDEEIFKKAVKYLENGDIEMLIDKIFKFENYQDAWDYLREGSFLGKIVIDFD